MDTLAVYHEDLQKYKAGYPNKVIPRAHRNRDQKCVSLCVNKQPGISGISKNSMTPNRSIIGAEAETLGVLTLK